MTRRILGWSAVALGALWLCGLPLCAEDSSAQPLTRHAMAFAVSPPLRELAKQPTLPHYGFHESNRVRHVNFHPRGHTPVIDPVLQASAGGSNGASIGLNVLGIGTGFPGYTVTDAPPDTNAAVGDTQVVEWVNVSFAVFDKSTGVPLTQAIPANTLWGALGAPCLLYNDGDPIVLWDKTAHRWLLAQNVFHGPPYYACVAVSTSPDATGTYYLYQFSLGTGFPDYPKWGIWPTGYFQTQNNFGPGGSGFLGAEVCAYNSVKLLAGDPSAEQSCVQLGMNDYSLLPGDLDSSTPPPPAGQDEFLIGSYDVDPYDTNLYLYSGSISSAWVLTVSPGSLVAVAPYNPFCDSALGCVPQVGTTDLLEGLGDRLMYRFAYFNDATPLCPAISGLPLQHWAVSHVVSAGGVAGMRWYELTADPTTVSHVGGTNPPVVAQQGTFAPADGSYRWMGSIARDRCGDMAMGYSIANPGSPYPPLYDSIAFAGRQFTTTVNQMAFEQMILTGTGSQSDTSNRWGDYSSMALDGTDGCTFWYTQEYYTVPASSYNWSTQLASIKFSTCP